MGIKIPEGILADEGELMGVYIPRDNKDGASTSTG